MIAEQRLARLYPAHLEVLRERAASALANSGYDHLVIFSGSERLKLFDDAPYPFVSNPQFKAWLPVTTAPDCLLVVTPNEAPRLAYYQPDDYWYAPPEPPGGYWAEHFDITITKKPGDGLKILPEDGRIAVLGEFAVEEMRPVNGDLNPESLLNHLDFQRAWKTPYELECMRQASHLAAIGHAAAEKAFRGGASELEIHLEYCRAAGHAEHGLPYSSIVALNNHGAILHYQNWSQVRFADADLHSFLIDAGASFLGYASDVTRTYSARDTGFKELIDRMDRAQLKLCGMLRPGVAYPEVHRAAHVEVANILSEMGFVTMSPEDLLAAGITHSFFPHGVGHYIGLQVHDVGGFLAGPDGTSLSKPADAPFLRLTRTVDAGQVMTIEPGLYFIDSLLAELGDSEHAAAVNWPQVDEFRKFGGVRIEDDVAVTTEGHENLTRDAFAALSG